MWTVEVPSGMYIFLNRQLISCAQKEQFQVLESICVVYLRLNASLKNVLCILISFARLMTFKYWLESKPRLKCPLTLKFVSCHLSPHQAFK